MFRKLLFCLLTLFALATAANAQSLGLTVGEVDGSPRATGIREIIVSNGTLTISGQRATITTGGGGGGGGCTPPGTANRVLYDNGAGGCTSAAGFTFNGTAKVTLGVAGSSVGSVDFKNATSGTITMQAVTGALGTVTLSLPARTATVATTTGTLTSGRLAEFDASGNLIQSAITATTLSPAGVANSIQVNNGGGLFDGGANAVLDLLTSTISLGTSSSQSGKLLLRNATNANTTTIQPGAPSSALTFTLPATLPASAGCLEVNSSGVITQTGSACGSGGGGANTALSNLASVAINTTLVSDTDNTDDLGTSAIRWKNLYLAGFVGDGSGNELLKFSPTASAVNEFTIANAATGGHPALSVTGGDTNINLRLTPKGTGAVSLSDGTATNPGLMFASDTDDGWSRGASDGWVYSYGGASKFYLVNNDMRGNSSFQYGWTNGSVTGSFDTHFLRAAASTVRLGNGGSGAGNLIVGTSAGAIGTSGAGVLAFTLSTAPSTSPTDTVQLYSNDFAAGDHRLYLRNEATAGSPVVTQASTDTLTNKTLTTPTIGDFTNATHNHSNATGGGQIAVASGISGFGTGVATALAVNVGSAGAFVTFNGAGGTPSSLTLTNATGLPPTTGISGWPANASGCLSNNGSGTLSWAACSGGGGGTPGGSDTQLQYNNAGSFGGISGATTNGTSVTLTSPTVDTGITLNAAPLTMSGNISAAAWTTSGIRIKGTSVTLTDTSSSGTVAAAYTNVLGGNTIAASSSTTFTDYYTTFITGPMAGTNVTLTNSWALGLSGAGSLTNNLAANTSGDGWVLQNASTASSGNQMFSPRIRLTGQGWKTNATAASQAVESSIEAIPVQGAANPSIQTTFSHQINAGGWRKLLTLTDSGASTPATVDITSTASAVALSLSGSAGTYSLSLTPKGTIGLLLSNNQVMAGGNGSVGTPVFSVSGNNTTGMYFASNQVGLSANGVGQLYVTSTEIRYANTAIMGFTSGLVSAARDTTWRRAAAANIAYGEDAASPVAYTLSQSNVTAGTSNTAGANWTFTGSRGTGTGNGGQFIFQTAPAGSSGSSQNALVTAMTIASDGIVYPKAYTHGNLPTPVNGDGGFVYCSDCTIASPCASGGSGAFAKRLNGAWVCN